MKGRDHNLKRYRVCFPKEPMGVKLIDTKNGGFQEQGKGKRMHYGADTLSQLYKKAFQDRASDVCVSIPHYIL